MPSILDDQVAKIPDHAARLEKAFNTIFENLHLDQSSDPQVRNMKGRFLELLAEARNESRDQVIRMLIMDRCITIVEHLLESYSQAVASAMSRVKKAFTDIKEGR